MWRRGLAIAAFAAVLVAAVEASAQTTTSLTGARIDQQGALTRLTLDLSEPVAFKVFTVSAPDRVVIDLPAVRWMLGERTVVIGHSGVARVRYGQFRPDTSRIVLDLDRPLTVRRTQMLPQEADGTAPHRLVLELAPASQPAEPVTQAGPAGPAGPVPLPQRKPGPKRERHLIAIDAGHGGRDPGAIATNGLQEKTLALVFAREFQTVLRESGRYGTVMTRDRDRKVGLHRRVEIAREASADLFLSIHLDRLENREVGGASVYTLSDEASDVETAELAARENRADIVADIDLTEGYDEDVAKVLISLVQQNTMNCSAALAATLLPELGRVAPLIVRPHRFGGFRVLKAPDIPSVLVELGFLSNDRDAERLTSESHRRELAGAILRALDTYFRESC